MTAITDAAIRRPRFVLWLAGLLSVFWIVLVAVPSVFDVPTLNGLRIDTDPENMLAEDEPVRAFHNEMMAEFGQWTDSFLSSPACQILDSEVKQPETPNPKKKGQSKSCMTSPRR